MALNIKWIGAHKIPLTKGFSAIVDSDDFEKLSKHKWCVFAYGYAVRREGKKIIWMHREINKTPLNKKTDHVNGNRLDNRKTNLRSCNDQQNGINRTLLNKNNTSGLRGIYWEESRKKWHSRIKVNFKDIHLGRFINLEDAINIRKEAEVKYFGEFSAN